MPADPLSDVLSLLEPETYVAGGLDLGPQWSLRFAGHTGIKCYAIVTGRAWLQVDGEPKPLLLEAGDGVLLPNGRSFVLADDLAIAPSDFGDVPAEDWQGGVVTLQGGGHAMLLGGHFGFAGEHVRLLLGDLPTIIRLRDDDDREGLAWALSRLRRELTDKKHGSILVARNLAHLMLVQTLRLYLASGESKGAGLLNALGDPRIYASIHAMHAEPGYRWTLHTLARRAAMSRSKFAERFKIMAGVAPIEYLSQWRMLLACKRLAGGSEPISSIATSLGYESESAFSTAFKRRMGVSPRQYAVNRR